MHAPYVTALMAVALGTAACSSVPDVVFLDTDSGGSSGSSGSSGTVPTPYSCPDKPPPIGEGVCCGTRLCLGCTQGHCERCSRAGCSGDDACCRGQGSNVDCRAPSTCL